jgi:acetyl esterase
LTVSCTLPASLGRAVMNMRARFAQVLTTTYLRVGGPALRAALRLSPATPRRLAGQPVVVDGTALDVEMQLILRASSLQPKRMTKTIEAGRATIDREARAVAGRPPIGSVHERLITGPESDLMIRVYRPRGLTGVSPALLFFHGGGFVYGSLDSHDGVCRFLAEYAQIWVVAVDYRLAPEHPFPAAHDDGWAAYTWLREHADELEIDVDRIAVGGDSAGGTIAAVLAHRGRDAGCAPAFQFLIYPPTDATTRRKSRDIFAKGYWLSDELMEFFLDQYLPPGTDRSDPRVSPLLAESLADLAPAYVLTAGFDPLRDEAEAYAHALSDAGVKVELRRHPGLIHTFANIVGAGHSGPAAMREAARALHAGLHR